MYLILAVYNVSSQFILACIFDVDELKLFQLETAWQKYHIFPYDIDKVWNWMSRCTYCLDRHID